jgi:hypothetical protein
MSRPEPPPYVPLPWRTIVSVAVVMAISITVLWSIIDRFDSTDVPLDDGTPGVAVIDPTVPPPDEGTPPSTPLPNGPTWPVGSLPDMLNRAPDRLADGSLPLNDIARYADIAAWTLAMGIEMPTSLDDPGLGPWEESLEALALPANLREGALRAPWRATYGFDLTNVEQVLVVGQAPDYVMIMRGTFDPQALQAAWVASGYQPVEVEGTTIWSLFPEDQVDLSAPESRPGMGTLNNVVILEDGTLISAARISQLGAALRVAHEDDPSLAEHADVASLLVPGTGVDTLASAVIDKGTLLQGTATTMPSPNGTPAATPPVPGTPGVSAAMPEARLVLLGIPVTNATPAGSPEPYPVAAPRLVMAIVVADADAARATRRGIEHRLATDTSPVTEEPYAARLGNVQLEVVASPDRPVVLITGDLARGPADWLGMLGDRDLGFAFWMP